jgi:mono/diheme cytochrome c family protein
MISNRFLTGRWTMTIQKSTGLAVAGLLLLPVGGASLAGHEGGTPQGKQGKEIKSVHIAYTEPTSGAQMYKNYCAACHGMEGKGDGPAARFLKAPPADLRTMAQRNNGKYPADYVAATLRSGTDSRAHGTSDMPIWGPVFRSRDKRGTQLRIHNLTEFVESLQQK